MHNQNHDGFKRVNSVYCIVSTQGYISPGMLVHGRSVARLQLISNADKCLKYSRIYYHSQSLENGTNSINHSAVVFEVNGFSAEFPYYVFTDATGT